MQEATTPQENSLNDAIRRWAELDSEFDAKCSELRMARESSAPWADDQVSALTDLLGQLMRSKEQLLARIKDRDVLEGVDSSLRHHLLRLVTENNKEAEELLFEDEYDIMEDPEFQNHAWDFVYNLGGPKDMLLRYRQTSVIVTSAAVPARISELFTELRTSYAVCQAHAVFALGRMILEAAITDIGVRIGRFPEPASLEDFYRAYPPGDRADKLLGFKGKRREEFRELYDAGSKAIHPSSQSTGIEPLEYLDRVVGFVNNEYAIQLRR